MAGSTRSRRLEAKWLAFGVTSAIYFFVYFHRMSLGVVVPEMTAAFRAGALPVGVMSSVFFYTYAVAQFVSGGLSDVIGVRFVISASTFVLFVGSCVFALAPSFGWAVAARGLIGLGAAGVWIPTMRFISDTHPPSSFATLSGVFGAAGNFGAVAAAVPFAWLVLSIGWRGSFWILGAITLFLSCLAWVVLGAAGSGRTGRPTAQALRQLLSGTRSVARSGQFWLLHSYQNLIHAPMIAVQGLWGCPYLMEVHGYSKIEAARIITLMGVGYIVGGPLGGYLSDRVFHSRKRLLLCISVLHGLTWFPLIQSRYSPSMVELCILFFLMGLTYGATLIAIAMVKESLPSEVFGSAMGLAGISLQVGTGGFQVIIGYILDVSRRAHVGASASWIGYRTAFFVCLATVCLSLLPLWLAHDTAVPAPATPEACASVPLRH